MKVQFLGAAKNVTGSCYYIDTGHYKFLVDCGQFQGSILEQKKNLEPFPFKPEGLDFIILTHAHIDHTGRLPILTKNGFCKKVYLTRATASLSEILLRDSGKIHEIECEADNEKRKKAGLDAVEPYYTIDDALYALQYFNPVALDKEIIVNEDISIQFTNAGHLLGSAHVSVTIKGQVLLFSGDIGTEHSEILTPPVRPEKADYVFIESTYGNRIHQDMKERFRKLYTLIKETVDQKGTVIIPAFAVGRTQDIIYGLNNLLKNTDEYADFLKIPFYVDSPLAIQATKVYRKDTEGMKTSLLNLIDKEKDPFSSPNIKFIEEAKDSIMLNKLKDPKVLISASGMCDAGRILHHLKTYLEKEKTNIIFVGYQSEESLGRKIMNHETTISIYDEEVINNANSYTLSGFSGHADQGELLNWLSAIQTPIKKVFLMHGEADALSTLDKKIKERYKLETYIPSLYETIEI